MQYERWFPIEMTKGQSHAYDLGTLLCSGDENSVRVGVEIRRNKIPEAVSGTIKGYVTLPNGLALMPFDGSKSANKAWIDLPEYALGMAGRINIAIRSFNGSQTTVLLLASATVRRVDADQYYDPDDYVGDITDLIEDAEQAAQDAADALAQATEIVSYAEQTGKTDAQKAQARANIGAAYLPDVNAIVNTRAPAISGTQSGSVVHFVADTALPLANVTAQIDFEQTGSGTAALDNVRPITIYDAVKVTVSPTADPDDGTEYSFDFPEEVGKIVCGVLDISAGTLTIEKYAFDPHDMASMSREINTAERLQLGIRPTNNGLPGKTASGSVCNRFSHDNTSGTPGYMTETTNWIYLEMPRADLADTNWTTIRQWFVDNPTIIVYNLAEPLVYHLTPMQINALAGDNYITADTGDLSVIYCADTQEYIDTAVGAVDDKADGIAADVGDVDDLETTAKDSVVSAVNEVNEKSAEMNAELATKAPGIIAGESGSVVHFVSSSASMIPGLSAQIVTSQQGSGEASPSNVRPILGFDAVTVTVSPSDDPTEGTEYEVEFPDEAGFVYGGTVDITAGTLTVTRFGFDPSLLTVAKDSATETAFTLSIRKPTNNLPDKKSGTVAISNRFSTTIAAGTPGRLAESNSYFYLILPVAEMSGTTLADAKAWLTAHPTVVVYDLATPLEYTMTPAQIMALVGDNYVSADTGDVTVAYVRDTKTYVDAQYDALHEMVEDQGADIPEYFAENLQGALAEYRANAAEVGHHGDSFVFITDPHWGVNQRHSPELIKWLVAKSNLRNVFCGGDILDSGTIANEMAKGYDFFQRFTSIPGGLKTVSGNHDYNKNGHASDSSYWLTPDQVYSIFCTKAEMEIHDVNSSEPDNDGWQELTFYVDVPATNTRYLFASIAYGAVFTVTKNWIVSQLENNPTLNFVIFSHYLYDSGDYTSGVKALFNLVKGYSNLKAWIYGHLHYDRVDYLDTGIPLVATDTDSSRLNSQNNPYTYDVGTITEQAFDVMTIGYANRDVACARVGRGKSRKINGGVNTVSGTLSLTTDISNPTWTSTNTSVATVSNGTVTGVAAGTAVIKAAGDHKEEFWFVSV